MQAKKIGRVAQVRAALCHQTGKPPPAGATLLMTALKAGRSSTFLRKGMRLQVVLVRTGQPAGTAHSPDTPGRQGTPCSSDAAQAVRLPTAGWNPPQEGQDGGEESGEEQPEAPHFQRKACSRVQGAGQPWPSAAWHVTLVPYSRCIISCVSSAAPASPAAAQLHIRAPTNVQPHTTSATPLRNRAEPL